MENIDRKSVLLLEDDSFFAQSMAAVADGYQLSLDCYQSLIELGSFAALGKFNVIVVNLTLESMSGQEVAQYVTAFFPNIPVLIIFDQTIKSLAQVQFPPCVRGTFCKKTELKQILAKCQELATESFPPLPDKYWVNRWNTPLH